MHSVNNIEQKTLSHIQGRMLGCPFQRKKAFVASFMSKRSIQLKVSNIYISPLCKKEGVGRKNPWKNTSLRCKRGERERGREL